ncbi:MAG: tetratricopeptide repeat protein [Saprospiraceae bacterium]|nr:tetratricopeptide repeat protein [Saprospiraceae bacterium]
MNIEQIDRYFSGHMDPNERAAFETKMNTDPSFKNEVLQYQKAVEAIKVYSRKELKDHLIKRTKQKNKVISKTKIILWIAIASIILLVILWLKADHQPHEIHQQLIPHSQDTSLQLKIANLKDTTINLQNKYAQTKNKNENSNADQLFAVHFSAFTDELLQSQVRGLQDEPTPFELFQQLYIDAQYKEALKIFETLDASLQRIDNFRFLQANAMMATNQIEEAKVVLKSILKNQQTRYIKEVYWYLALCEIQQRNFSQAKTYLLNSELKYDKKAQTLLNKISN